MANLNLGQDVAKTKERLLIKWPNLIPLRMRHYGSLININPSGFLLLIQMPFLCGFLLIKPPCLTCEMRGRSVHFLPFQTMKIVMDMACPSVRPTEASYRGGQ